MALSFENGYHRGCDYNNFNSLAIGAAHNKMGHILNAEITGGRLSSVEHHQIQNSICNAQGAIQNSICDNGRYNSSEHGQISSRVCDAEGKILSNVGKYSSRIIGDVKETEYKNSKNISNATNFISGNVVNTSNTLRSSVERTGKNINTNIYRISEDIKDAVNLNGNMNEKAIFRNGYNTLRSIENNSLELRIQAERIARENRSSLDNNNTNVILSAKDQLLTLCKAENLLAKQAADNKRKIEIEAFKNNAELSKQTYDCCCELKQKIRENSCEIKSRLKQNSCATREKIDDRANYTQSLLRAQSAADLRDKLTAKQTEILITKLYH